MKEDTIVAILAALVSLGLSLLMMAPLCLLLIFVRISVETYIIGAFSAMVSMFCIWFGTKLGENKNR